MSLWTRIMWIEWQQFWVGASGGRIWRTPSGSTSIMIISTSWKIRTNASESAAGWRSFACASCFPPWLSKSSPLLYDGMWLIRWRSGRRADVSFHLHLFRFLTQLLGAVGFLFFSFAWRREELKHAQMLQVREMLVQTFSASIQGNVD